MKISLSSFVAACFLLSIGSIKANHLLEYKVVLDTHIAKNFEISMKMNEVHVSEDIFAPSMCTTALNMIAGDLLNIVFPVDDRKPNVDYPEFDPDCYDPRRMDCFIEYDLTEFWPADFEIKLAMKIDELNHELLKPDENGNLPPNRLITVDMEVDLIAKSDEEEVDSLVQLKSKIDEIFHVDAKEATYAFYSLEEEDDEGDDDYDEF